MGPKLMTIGTVTTQGSIERRKELLKSQEGGIWRLSFTRAETCGQGGLRSQRGLKREEAGKTYFTTIFSPDHSHWPPHWLKPMRKPEDEGAW